MASCTVTIARHVRGQLVGYVGNSVGTKGGGRREPYSYSLRQGGPIGKVPVHRCYRNVNNNKDRFTPTALNIESYLRVSVKTSTSGLQMGKMVFIIMNSIHILEEVKNVDDDHTTIC